jgi:hypothetical protein
LRRPHREVYVFGLQVTRFCGPVSRVAGVNEGDLNGVGNGGNSFAKIMRRPTKTWRGCHALVKTACRHEVIVDAVHCVLSFSRHRAHRRVRGGPMILTPAK